MKKHIQASASLNNKLVQEILQPAEYLSSIRQLVMEIRTVNQKIRTTNQYVKSDRVNQYLIHERECSIRILLLLHDLDTQKISTREIEQSVSLAQDRGERIEALHALPEESQKLLLLSMTEILRENPAGARIRFGVFRAGAGGCAVTGSPAAGNHTFFLLESIGYRYLRFPSPSDIIYLNR